MTNEVLLQTFIDGQETQADLSLITGFCDKLQEFIIEDPELKNLSLSVISAGLKVYAKTIDDSFPPVKVKSNIYKELISTQTTIQEEPLNEDQGGQL